ncbi:MAG: phosphoribosylformylglycinamidine synthase subunit PurQ [Euryarchaeota archaeon]|nr:phosphoribosylformylglycinamidine synthase subunit PurQ [Euryarchaeota archaeon]MBV1728957.1 phosphoribosylformylglycinamidine synthase subunit PurQ [Methanobacterium sp.]MBU4547309.1 phosphoribosylformylglycinamidine synthase subunit PurQ [Euryarchaeota archaeon]MBU4608133.1 phosphoribosylformylglycinamidine synthase subunit PurQ [Euryarchaeota archaeon]MBV1755630.1 phosphoribosylformylglycinamidine synthase subunit PurQ [Methanobacterium sp.]
MKVGVIRFPGSNCDRDVYHALELAGGEPEYVWWKENDFLHMDAVVIPGGFSYGDYLRAGAIAAITPAIEGIKKLVAEEKPVLGICNGAQILSEVGLVPGVFTVNENPKFNCQWTQLKVKTNRTPFTRSFEKDQLIKMPVAHAEGRYYNPDLDLLQDQDQIVLKFHGENPNGSLEGITGVCDESGLVCAVMPHPERASESILGSSDGLNFFKGMINY